MYRKERLGSQKSKTVVRETRLCESTHKGQAVTVIKGRGRGEAGAHQMRHNTASVC